MTIGELARQTGVAASAIRYYESVGLLPAAPRSGGRRVFDESAKARLAVIRFAKEVDFSLDEIRELFGTFSARRWRPLAKRKLSELDLLTARITAMGALLRKALRCGCVDIEECGRRIGARQDAASRHRVRTSSPDIRSRSRALDRVSTKL